MLNLKKAASIVAVSVTLVSAAIYAVPGFASGNSQVNMAVSANSITIDAGVIAADVAKDKLASDPSTQMTVEKNGDVIFTPGIGDTQPMAVPEEYIPETQDKAQDKSVTDRKSAGSLRALVNMQDTDAALDSEARCLAGAVYFEAKGESLAGQLAVAEVVLARKNSGRFPASICGVVYQKSQFSFVRGGKMPPITTGGQQWKNAVAIAQIALNDGWASPVAGALFFHAKYVSPGWKLKRIGSIDQHIFYR
jgi:Cell Wall Hydrolase